MTSPPLNSPSIPLELNHELALAGFDLFLSLAVLAGIASLYALYLTLRPLFESGDISNEEWMRLEDDSFNLLRRRDRVVAELRDLEFEAAMDKLDDQDLAQLRRQYKREALSLIEELEESERAYLGDLNPPASTPSASESSEESSEESAPAEPKEPTDAHPSEESEMNQEETSHES